jgi:hypothetical protein
METDMDIETIVDEFRRSASDQMRLAGNDTAAADAGEALLHALEPALRLAAFTLAEQAASEITAQLPDHHIEVVMADGQPGMAVRRDDTAATISTENCDARMTVRLPEDLKNDLESAASESGDSVNSLVVKSLAGSAEALKRTSRSTFKGRIRT